MVRSIIGGTAPNLSLKLYEDVNKGGQSLVHTYTSLW